ncbi:MAG: DUF4178 domain-containing protein [Polyangiaceae bacterium]
MSGLDRQAACPTCGATITFPFGGAKAVVCDHCRSVVARTDRGLVSNGTMAELLELPTPFTLHRTGSWRGETFEVQGRVQMDRADQASAPWQEILLVFPRRDDHTWIAHAQGRWFATAESPYPEGALPPFEALQPASRITLGPHGTWVVQEISQRRVVSGEGALSGVPAPGVITRYADISAEGGRFGTIDYGDQTTPPILYLGQTFDPAEVRFDDGMPLEAPEAAVTAPECPNCGASLPLQSQASERIICQYCGTASDIRDGHLAALGPAPMPPIPPAIAMGQSGVAFNHRYVVTGFVIRSCVVEGTRYPWREYLLYGGPSVGYRWLMEEDGKWTFAEPVDAGAVLETGLQANYLGKAYQLSQTVDARVDYVIGEFYWKIEIGETVEATEWSGPGGKLSRERSPQEVNYSLSQPIGAADLASFGVARPASSWSSKPGWSWPKIVALGCGALIAIPTFLFVLLMIFAVATSKDFEDVQSGKVPLDAAERAAIENLLQAAKIPPSSLNVHDDQTSKCDWCTGIVIENGHVTLLKLEQKTIPSSAPLAALPELRVLRLPKDQLHDTTGLGKLAHLETADLSGNELTTVDDLSGCKALTSLDLRNNHLETLTGLHDLPQLVELHLEDNPIQSLAGLSGLDQLTRLELAATPLTSFAGLGKLPKLTSLSVSDSKLTSLEGLDGLLALEELSVRKNQLTELTSLAPLPALRVLDATDNQITSLAGSERLPALKKLTLAKNRIASLEGAPDLPTLETLDLRENQLTDLALPTYPKLTSLAVDQNQLTTLQAALPSLVGLTTLTVGHNQLTSLDGTNTLTKLTTLDVESNKLTTLDPIAGMPGLADVNARSNQLEQAGVVKFLATPPTHYDLTGNLLLTGIIFQAGRYLPAPPPKSSTPSGTRGPTSRYRSGGGPSLGK